MIDWVDRRLMAWGKWRRESQALGYGESPIARAMRGNIEQPRLGLCLRVTDDDALEVDAAVGRLPKDYKRLMIVWYGTEEPSCIVAKRLGVSRSTINNWRGRAHVLLAPMLSEAG